MVHKHTYYIQNSLLEILLHIHHFIIWKLLNSMGHGTSAKTTSMLYSMWSISTYSIIPLWRCCTTRFSNLTPLDLLFPLATRVAFLKLLQFTHKLKSSVPVSILEILYLQDFCNMTSSDLTRPLTSTGSYSVWCTYSLLFIWDSSAHPFWTNRGIRSTCQYGCIQWHHKREQWLLPILVRCQF